MSDLAELGLSSYEEKVYRALLGLGPSTAREASVGSGVPMGRIYDVLNGLEARQLVRVQPGEPRRYVAAAPEEAVDRLLDERLRELEAEREHYRDLAESVGSTLAPTPPTEGNVWTTTLGSEDAVTLLRDQVQRTDDRLLVAVGEPFESAPWDRYSEEFEVSLEELHDGIAVRLLVSDAFRRSVPTSAATRLREADLETRTLPRIEVTFDVVDGREAYVDLPHPFVEGERFGFVSVTDEAIAGQFEREFEAAWADADPLE